MRKSIALFLTAIMAFAVMAGCSTPDAGAAATPTPTADSTPTPVAEPTAEPVKLIVATTCMTAPYSFYDENNNPTGSEIALWNEIASRTGYEVEFTVADFAGITAAVDSKVADVASNCLGYTEQRAEKYQLSEPYLYQGLYLTVRDDDDSINGMEDLAGKIVACEETSVSKAVIDEYAAANGMEGQIDYLYTATGSFMLEVNLGRADALISQRVNFLQKMKTGEFQLKQVGDPIYEEQAVFLFRKDMDPAIVEAVNQAVADMREDGTLSAIYTEWLGVDLSESALS